LPRWIPEVTLRNLRVGRSTVDLRFTRNGDGSASHKVLRKDGTLVIAPAGPPSNAKGTRSPWIEQVERAMFKRAPGRLVRAARIAVGLGED
jgi:hypothetical protein